MRCQSTGSWDHPATVQAEHVFGSTEGVCLTKALQQGLLLLHRPMRVCAHNLEPSIIQFTSSFPLRTEVPLNCSTRILTFSPLLGSVLLLAARQRCQSVPSSRAVKQSRVWLRELQQQLLDKCFPYHLLLANNASSCRRDHGAAAFVTFLKRS